MGAEGRGGQAKSSGFNSNNIKLKGEKSKLKKRMKEEIKDDYELFSELNSSELVAGVLARAATTEDADASEP